MMVAVDPLQHGLVHDDALHAIERALLDLLQLGHGHEVAYELPVPALDLAAVARLRRAVRPVALDLVHAVRPLAAHAVEIARQRLGKLRLRPGDLHEPVTVLAVVGQELLSDAVRLSESSRRYDDGYVRVVRERPRPIVVLIRHGSPPYRSSPVSCPVSCRSCSDNGCSRRSRASWCHPACARCRIAPATRAPTHATWHRYSR